MSVAIKDMITHGSATMPDDDIATQIGGAEDTSIKVFFKDLSGNDTLEIVSSNAGDTMNVTVDGRDSSGAVQQDTKALTGQTPVSLTGTFKRILKAVKASSGASGDIAVMAVTNENTGTAQGGGVDYIDLAAGASAVDGAYNGMVIRTLAGTGPNQIKTILDYNGTSKRALVSSDWGTDPDATTTYEVSRGLVFDLAPNEVTECRRIFYDTASKPIGQGSKIIYEKIFIRNKNTTDTLTNAQVKEIATGGSGFVDFDLESALDGSDDNGGGNNREVDPGGYTFDSADKTIVSGNFTNNTAIGMWLRLTLPEGQSAEATFWEHQVVGDSAA